MEVLGREGPGSARSAMMALLFARQTSPTKPSGDALTMTSILAKAVPLRSSTPFPTSLCLSFGVA